MRYEVDTATRPDDTAVRNYWLLRERIAEFGQIIKGLQEYILSVHSIDKKYKVIKN